MITVTEFVTQHASPRCFLSIKFPETNILFLTYNSVTFRGIAIHFYKILRANYLKDKTKKLASRKKYI